MSPEERIKLKGLGFAVWENHQMHIGWLLIERGLLTKSTKATLGVILFSFLAATGLVISQTVSDIGALVTFTHKIVNKATPLEDTLSSMDTFAGPWDSSLIDFIMTAIPAKPGPNSSFYVDAAIFNNAYVMLSCFYPTVVMHLTHELSSTAMIHEAATAIYQSQSRAKA
ncbi:hypothetical protein H0H92_003805 [Tricholoma furcatifolium]|nr:hypothetical protein H0H92_003805 [Tricholoma furcatifolium]